MPDAKPQWQGPQLNELQGPSSLGMALSGGAVGFSAAIINPNVYVGFWTSFAIQVHAGFQVLSVAFGVLFFFCRLRSNDVTALIEQGRRAEGDPAPDEGRLEQQARRFAVISRYAIYAQIVLLCGGGLSFLWLMLIHFHRALYP
jgi:hypothetical protein